MARKVTRLWTMRDGTQIRICDMTTTHLRNCLRMLERNHEHMIREMYSASVFITAECAVDSVEKDIQLCESEGPAYTQAPFYEDMLGELLRRGEDISEFVERWPYSGDELLGPVVTPRELRRCRNPHALRDEEMGYDAWK